MPVEPKTRRWGEGEGRGRQAGQAKNTASQAKREGGPVGEGGGDKPAMGATSQGQAAYICDRQKRIACIKLFFPIVCFFFTWHQKISKFFFPAKLHSENSVNFIKCDHRMVALKKNFSSSARLDDGKVESF